MNNRTFSEEFIFNKWDLNKLSFSEIAKMKIPVMVSLSRLRNIIYSKPNDVESEFVMMVRKNFRIKFLELNDVPETIKWVYNNQPAVTISEDTVRRVVNDVLKRKR